MKLNVFFTIILIYFFTSFGNLGHAFDLDETIDDDIRKTYNPTKIVDDTAIKASSDSKQQAKAISQDEELPSLPEITKYDNTVKKSEPQVKYSAPQQQTVTYKRGNTRIHKGTTFEAVNSAAISDWQTRGTTVKFETKSPIYGKNYTLPAGTVFQGEILEAHQPQISCNGGLVVIRIYSLRYKGQTIQIKGYVTRANEKKIFFNNIKGKRTYLQTVYKKGGWGRSIFNKMLSLTINLGGSGSTIALSPFPLAYGTICLGANTLFSPISAFFSKGGHVSIPAGKKFKIKLLEDIYI